MSLRDVAVQVAPIGPLALRILNRGETQRRRQLLADVGLPPLESERAILPKMVELCGYNERLFPENARYWKCAADFAEAQAEGAAAMLSLVQSWGFVVDRQGVLQVPDWWASIVVPMEYMDYHDARHGDAEVQALNIDPARYRPLARVASDSIWMAYYLAKGCLSHQGVSLLVSEVSSAAAALKARVPRPEAGPLPVWVIGLSEDEVAALRGPDVAVVGFNLGLSPVLERAVRAGEVRALVARRDGPEDSWRLLDATTLDPVELEGGKAYVCQTDVSVTGLPVPERSGIAMTNETLHHNTYAQQATMLRELHRAALPVEGGGRAWVAGELFRSAYMPQVLLGLSSSIPSTCWDAWVSFVNGIACVEELERKREAWRDEGVDMHFTQVPRGLVGAPRWVHRYVMCPTQTLITGYATS